MRAPFPIRTALLLLLLGCEKNSSQTSGGPAAHESAPSAPLVAPSATSATSAAEPSAKAPEAEPPAVAAPADAGKGKDGGGATAQAGAKHVEGNNFTLDLASSGCKAGAECAMTIKLVAAADYHVNKEYPYKFTASPAAGIDFLGKGDAATFTRAAGDFVSEGEKTGTMTVRFKPSSAGEARIGGVYKFSVCSDDQCQIEQEKLELAVTVM